MRAQCLHLSGSEQRERLMSMSREAPLGQGLSALDGIVAFIFTGKQTFGLRSTGWAIVANASSGREFRVKMRQPCPVNCIAFVVGIDY